MEQELIDLIMDTFKPHLRIEPLGQNQIGEVRTIYPNAGQIARAIIEKFPQIKGA